MEGFVRPRGLKLAGEKSVLDFVKKSANLYDHSSMLLFLAAFDNKASAEVFLLEDPPWLLFVVGGGRFCAEAAEYDIAPGVTTGGVGTTGVTPSYGATLAIGFFAENGGGNAGAGFDELEAKDVVKFVVFALANRLAQDCEDEELPAVVVFVEIGGAKLRTSVFLACCWTTTVGLTESAVAPVNCCWNCCGTTELAIEVVDTEDLCSIAPLGPLYFLSAGTFC